jgi:hypothetical protein
LEANPTIVGLLGMSQSDPRRTRAHPSPTFDNGQLLCGGVSAYEAGKFTVSGIRHYYGTALCRRAHAAAGWWMARLFSRFSEMPR